MRNISRKISAKYLSPGTTAQGPESATLVADLGRRDRQSYKQSVKVYLTYDNHDDDGSQEGIIYLDHAQATELGVRLIELAVASRDNKG